MSTIKLIDKGDEAIEGWTREIVFVYDDKQYFAMLGWNTWDGYLLEHNTDLDEWDLLVKQWKADYGLTYDDIAGLLDQLITAGGTYIDLEFFN